MKDGIPRTRLGRLNIVIMGQLRKAREITKITTQSSFVTPLRPIKNYKRLILKDKLPNLARISQRVY